MISVILPVYNGGEFLKQSVNSVLKQDYKDFEILIIDDCSTDGSYEWLQTLQDDRIRLYRNENNKGLFYNLNFLVQKSNGVIIKLWAQDDIMYPQCLGKFVKFHIQHPQIGFSYSGMDGLDEKGNLQISNRNDNTPDIISTERHALIAYYTGSIAGNIANVCIRKDALEKVGAFNEQMRISADFDMWVRLAEHFETGFIKEPLIKLRGHSGQLSRNEKYYINHVKEDLQVYRYLNSYVTKEIKAKGKKLIREQKLIFYYILMAKALMTGHLKLFKDYWFALSEYDNIFILSGYFIKKKITGFIKNKPGSVE